MMTYKEQQKLVVDYLRELGIWHEYHDRLAAFWYKLNIKYVIPGDRQHLVPGIQKELDELINMRKQGLEPHHENGEYVRGTGNDNEGEVAETTIHLPKL